MRSLDDTCENATYKKLTPQEFLSYKKNSAARIGLRRDASYISFENML